MCYTVHSSRENTDRLKGRKEITMNNYIAETILQQLGGHRFIVMTGAKNFIALQNGLRFTIGRNASKANRVEITLNGLDLYDIKFIKHTPYSMRIDHKRMTVTETQEKTVVVREFNDIFFDQLQELFTETTGLYTRL